MTRRVGGLLLVCWVLFPLGPLSFVMLILLPIAMWRAIRSGKVAAVLFVILANPLSFFFLRGVMDYAGGKPALLGMGLPGAEYANIDPETRCLHASGGCVIRGDEWVIMAPHNFALRTMAHILGPPAQTYDGPYPTREEALAASASGNLVSPAGFRSGVIPTDTGSVRIDPVIVEQIGTCLFSLSGYAAGDLTSGEQLHAVVWQKRCLILRWRGATEPDEVTDEVVVLIDTRNGRPFAVYRIAGDSYLRRAGIGMFWR